MHQAAPPSGAGSSDRATDETSPTVRTNHKWWDDNADEYQAAQSPFLDEADFVWCPEGLRERDARLLGPVDGRWTLEVGAGAAQCSRWLAKQGASAVALDISSAQLSHAKRMGVFGFQLVQANAERLPFHDAVFELAFSAFGALTFVANSSAVMTEIARVLRPGGRWVFSTWHPARWCFRGPRDGQLVVNTSYFDRTPYVEMDSNANPKYVEHHRTMGDRIRDVLAAGLSLIDVVEPEWPSDRENLGPWADTSQRMIPNTVIFVAQKGEVPAERLSLDPWTGSWRWT